MLSEGCIEDLKKAFTFQNETLFPPHYDATGKPGSGVLEGNTVAFGNYDQCVSLDDGKYCLVDATLAVPKPENMGMLFRWGLCSVPSCNESVLTTNINQIANEILQLHWLNITHSDINCAENLSPTRGFYAAVSVIAIMVLLTIAGTIADIVNRHKHANCPKFIHSIDVGGPQLIDPNESSEELSGDTEETRQQAGASGSIQGASAGSQRERKHLRSLLRHNPSLLSKLLICFSIPRNLGTILGTQVSDKAIPCLNGLRVVSIAWIVLGHTFLATFASGSLVNPKRAIGYSKSVLWQPVGNAYFAVDTFFFLSGLLVAYLSLHEMKKYSGKFPFMKFYLHRYLRLTPVVAFLMLFWIYVKPSLGSGPVWFSIQSDPMCDQYWWPNLLYIQNFYPSSMEQQCVGWTWYLALDMQFYLVSPVLVIAIYRRRKVGLWLLAVGVISSILTTAVLIALYDIDVNLTWSVLTNNYKKMMDYENIVYGKPYCRIGAYLVGMLFGYIIHEQQTQTHHHYLTKVRAVGGWFMSTVIMACLIWSFYPAFHGHPLNRAENVVYGSLSHVIWAFAIGCVVYLCWHGYGSLINDALSWRGFTPLSRLTYSVYLFHPVFQFVIFHNIKTAIHVSNIFIVIMWSSVFFLACIASVLVMLLVEIPLRNLEELVTSKSRIN